MSSIFAEDATKAVRAAVALSSMARTRPLPKPERSSRRVSKIAVSSACTPSKAAWVAAVRSWNRDCELLRGGIELRPPDIEEATDVVAGGREAIRHQGGPLVHLACDALARGRERGVERRGLRE